MPNALLLALSHNRRLRTFAERSRMGRRVSRRFVAGEVLDDALAAVEASRGAGLTATLDHLGENVATPEAAAAAAASAVASLQALRARGLEANVSIKLTQLGLDLDLGLAERHLRAVAERAGVVGGFVRVDMEGSAYTDRTLELALAAHQAGLPVGTVLQASLRRTAADLEQLVAAGVPIRLVKGAYLEPASIAYATKREVDASYDRLLARLLASGHYPAIATHDPAMIAAALATARAAHLPPEGFEFQMLYGIRRDLQAALRRQGWRVRVYIPYGAEWYPYFMRRLAERPANLLFLLRNVLR
ncbi:MAG: proline dehydrogenase family protein [Terriglobales bacterium]